MRTTAQPVEIQGRSQGFNLRLDPLHSSADVGDAHLLTLPLSRAGRPLALPASRDASFSSRLATISSYDAFPVPTRRRLKPGVGRLPGERTALLGIGSGLSCVMLGLEWNGPA